MAVDTTLIKGAYEANRPIQRFEGNIATAAAGSISSALNTYVINEKKKADKADAEFLTNIANAKLDPTNSNNLINATAEQRQAYIDADSLIDKQKILNDINSIAIDLGGIEDIIEDLQEGDIEISNTFTHTEEGKDFANAISDPNRIEIVDGKAGITINGEFMDVNAINDYVKSKSMDTSFSEVMKAVEFGQQEDRKDYGDDYEFDRAYVRSQIRADITKNSNARSLFEDNLYGNRNFKADLIEALGNQTYGNLGITEDMLSESDVNVSDGLDEQEIKNITEYLMNDEFTLRDMLTEYYTDLIEDQFAPISSSFQQRVDAEASSQKSEDSSGDITGVSVDSDGVYVPEQKPKVSALTETDSFNSMLKQRGFKNANDKDILEYFKDMKGRLSTEIYNASNFSQWLKNNDKPRLELNY